MANDKQKRKLSREEMLRRWSVLNSREVDIEGWRALRRIALVFAFAGWAAALLLTLWEADLALWRSPRPVTYLSVYHGVVQRLDTVARGGGGGS